jgi:hypothetical protein
VLLQRAVAPGEVTSSSHRAASVRGRTLFCRWAVVDLGVSSNAVARFPGVMRQSVRRALERCDHVLGNLGCAPEELRGSTFRTTAPDGNGKA